MRRTAPVILTLAIVASASAAACIGQIGSEDGTTGPGGKGPGSGSGQTTSPLRDPGSKTLHRLNRVEYDNTVRDLLGTSLRPAEEFPADDHGYGFDNIADVLALSPLQVELYERAAERLVEDAFADDARAKQLVACDLAEEGCATKSVEAFATRAFRRPVEPAELAKLAGFVDLVKGEGGTTFEGVKLAMRAALVSPSFLFRVEVDPDPSVPSAHALNDWEIASRLSYFLWSSMPDPALFAAAAEGKLQDPKELAKHALRMIEDPRSKALVDNFAGQWLAIREMDHVTPEAALFPDFDDTLRRSMRKETELFFAEFMRGDLDLTGLLTADFSFVDARLAEHYGMSSPGADFTKVKIDTSKRRGLFGQGTFLTTSSYPNRTSPVKRGRWVLEQLLCTPPPPPPPGVEGLDKPDGVTGTVRERMEAHRKQPVCASCHQLMDPIGFGLENFDGIGKWRTEEAGSTIDASGKLPGAGATFAGGSELALALADDARVGRCVAQHLYTYALGRGPEASDQIYLDEIASGTKGAGNRMKDLIVQIVTSEPFRMRRAAIVKEGGTP